jgi:multiple sugar transport system substrate-binding protein
MKKLLMILTVLVFALTLSACDGETDPKKEEETPENTAPVITGVVDGDYITVKVGATVVALDGITAADQDGNALDIKVTGNFDLDTVGEYTVTISVTDSNSLKTSLDLNLSVIALTCEENPDQEACKTDVDRAREVHEGTIYNVDKNSDGTPDWQQDTIELVMGYSYYGADDETNAVWMNVLKFMEQYPNISVTRDPLYTSGWENGDDGLLLIQENALLEGTLPDVFFNPKGAETYDKGMTLDLKPYIDTDQEATMITPNALSGMMTYDNLEMWGIPWQGVGPLVALNTGLLADLGITAPGYDWTYEEYEALRNQVGSITNAGQCVFPGVIDFSIFGPNYFDSVPNGYKGYNTITKKFDFAGAAGYGAWLEGVATEAKQGWHFFDLSETDAETKCPDVTDSWTDGVRGINTIYLWEFNSAINRMVDKGFDVDIYPYPISPDGGQTATYTYHDYYSLSKLLEADRVKAEAAFQLVKWLTFGEDGLESRWDLIYDNEASDFVDGTRYLMDYIQGWPITSNPNVMALHPLVKGFDAESPLARFNFEAFKNMDFQYQMSNANPYPRHIPAFASVANAFDPWTIKDQMRDESLSFIDIAPGRQETLNEEITEYLQYYVGVE